jgi:hypothetical protein
MMQAAAATSRSIGPRPRLRSAANKGFPTLFFFFQKSSHSFWNNIRNKRVRWTSYRTGQVKGSGPQPLQTELREVDSSVNLERWVPDPNIPSLVAHRRKLKYENQCDQKAVCSFQGEIGDVCARASTLPRPLFSIIRLFRTSS